MLALLTVAEDARSQAATATIRGSVVNIRGFRPIPQAEVWLEDTPLRTLTDLEGAYTIAGVPPGEYVLIVRRIGFELVATVTQRIVADSTHTIDLALEPAPVRLAELGVTADKADKRSVTAASTVLTAAELRGGGDVLTAIQGRVPGIRVSGAQDNVRVAVRGARAEPIFVINGTVARPPLRFYFQASDVACVEVRRGRHAALEYKPSGSDDTYSGVILIWTKDRDRRMTGGCDGKGG